MEPVEKINAEQSTATVETATTVQPSDEQEAQRRAFFQAKAEMEQEIADKVQIFASQYATEVTVNCKVEIKATNNANGTITVTTDSVRITTTIGQKAF